MTIASMRVADLAAVAEINAMNLDDVDPVDAGQLAAIHQSSRIALVAEAPDVGVVGFGLVVDDDCAYRSERTAWALTTGDADLHLERVAFDMSYSGLGLGLGLYDELDDRIIAIGRATDASSVAITSMIRVDPPNRHAVDFHAARGFETVERAVFGETTIALARKTFTIS